MAFGTSSHTSSCTEVFIRQRSVGRKAGNICRFFCVCSDEGSRCALKFNSGHSLQQSQSLHDLVYKTYGLQAFVHQSSQSITFSTNIWLLFTSKEEPVALSNMDGYYWPALFFNTRQSHALMDYWCRIHVRSQCMYLFFHPFWPQF